MKAATKEIKTRIMNGPYIARISLTDTCRECPMMPYLSNVLTAFPLQHPDQSTARPTLP